MSVYLSIGAVFKDETDHLREWIEYHRIVGVERFYLLCNDDDPTPGREVLAPYIESGLVIFEVFPSHEQEWIPRIIFERILEIVREDSTWVMFIDLDEFALPKQTDSLPKVLRSYDRDPIGGLVMHWKCFNSAGHLTHPKKTLQIEAYTRCLPDRHRFHATVKSVIRTHTVDKTRGGHVFRYKPGFYHVNELKVRVPDGVYKDSSLAFRNVQLNHYSTRSKADYARKIQRGWPRPRSREKSVEVRWRLWDKHHEGNIFDDEMPKRFSARVRRALDWPPRADIKAPQP